MEHLLKHNRDYVKIWIDPWYRLIRRNPPVWLSRIMLKALVEIYHSWNKTLISLGEPYYLRIWLFDPNFINSQVVVAIRDCLDFYKFNEGINAKSFPQEKYQLEQLTDFHWKQCIDETIYFKNIDELEEEFITKLTKKAYAIEETTIDNKPDTMYKIYEGEIWEGSIKTL
ncbi:hypothetical protein VN24_21900 [Paenibacillus beijingensis]|uniref:Uncharacterized protein n=1 Tax=Paenibacillus beijingensis TaxID=1126833 RepID=A0A0D5NRZ8_9BACL|nr:hypothetical protein VN24_21900 [Paenibacillus beijingensis]